MPDCRGSNATGCGDGPRSVSTWRGRPTFQIQFVTEWRNQEKYSRPLGKLWPPQSTRPDTECHSITETLCRHACWFGCMISSSTHSQPTQPKLRPPRRTQPEAPPSNTHKLREATRRKAAGGYPYPPRITKAIGSHASNRIDHIMTRLNCSMA